MDSMTVTLSLRDVFLLVLWLLAAGAMLYFILVLRRILAVAESFQRVSKDIEGLMPKVKVILEGAEGFLTGAQALVREGHQAARDVTGMTGAVRTVVEEAVSQITLILTPIRLVASAVKAVQDLTQRFAGRWLDSEEETEDSDEERDF